MTGPLDGIRVLDLGANAPGPFCGMVLGDLGADVISIHDPRPVGGRRAEQAQSLEDASTRLYAALEDSPALATRRNKRSLGLNLKDPRGRDLLYRLVREADVVITEMRPGAAARLGIDYETLQELEPRLVYCAISGYGQNGPLARLPGHDLNYLAQAGLLDLIRGADGRHAIPQNLIADFAGGGLTAALGVLAALFARTRTGRGQLVDVSMLDGVIYLMADFFSNLFAGMPVDSWRENLSAGRGMPLYDVYETKDGRHLSIATLEPWFIANLFRAIGREGLTPLAWDEKSWPELRAALSDVFRTRTRDEWCEALEKEDVAVGRVLELDEVAEDPQVRARGMITDVLASDGSSVAQVGVAPRLSETPGSIRRRSFRQGEHSDDILFELGLSAAEIGELRGAGTVG